MDKQEKPRLTAECFWKSVFYGVVLGTLLVLAPFFVVVYTQNTFEVRKYSMSLLIILPFVQGFVAGYVQRSFWAPSAFGTANLIILADYVAATIGLKEGVVCLVMGYPLFLVITMLGFAICWFIYRGKRRSGLNSLLMPVVVLAVVMDASQPEPVFYNAISDAVTINAPPEKVWQYIVEYPANESPPDYWLWKIGLPVPIQSVATAKEVGAVRECKFTDGITFEEEITELVPNKVLTFKVTKQPDHPEIIGHFSLDKGQIYLEANADGTTTLIATSWYRIFVKPAFYFDWWAADITRNVHFRVLGHIKQLAESDSAGAKVASAAH